MWFLFYLSLLFADPSESKEWMTLLHMVHGESLVTSQSFFFSESRNAKDEFTAFKQEILRPYLGDDRKDPQCRFPARTDYVFKTLGLDSKLRRPCPYWEEWKSFIQLENLSVIYASTYMSAPSSFFGHTFLKLVSKKSGGKDLLDYGVDAAAITGEDKGLRFALKGIFGYYPLRFSVLPYHIKVKEYANLEGRDIWTFPLQLTEEQKQKVLHHLIELENADFSYYYFDQNCSYFILSFLQAIYSDSELLEPFWFSVIPIDTLKVLQKEELIDSFSFRPSAVREIEAKWLRLSKEEQKEVKEQNLKSMASIDLQMDLEYLKTLKGEDRSKELFQLQLHRASLGKAAPVVRQETQKKSILSEMPSTFISVGGGEDFSRIQILPALKDSLTPSHYFKDFSIHLLDTKIEKYNSKTYLRNFSLLSIASYPSFTSLFKNYSYEFSLQYKDRMYTPASEHLNFALGASLPVFIGQVQSLLKMDLTNRQQGGGGVMQWMYQKKRFQFLYRFEYLYYTEFKDYSQNEVMIGYNMNTNQLRLIFENEKKQKDRLAIEFVRYF